MLIINRLIAIICIGIGLVTTACSRYRLGSGESKDIDTTKTGKEEEVLDRSRLFEVDNNGMTQFCRAIMEGDYEKLRPLLSALLREIEHLKTISYDVVYLITGYKLNKQDNKQYPKRALLEQVLTSYEGERSKDRFTEKMLHILFKILCKYTFGLKEVFMQKHGNDENTIIHLAINTADVAIVKCLLTYYLNENNNDIHGLLSVFTMSNWWGETPISIVAEADHSDPLCGRHAYDMGCDTCDYEFERQVGMEKIMLYLLELGVPFHQEAVFNYGMKYNAGDCSLVLKMLRNMQNSLINQYTSDDVASLKDDNGNSLLFYAVLCRDYELVDYLLALGACPMYFNYEGICPLFLAIAFRDIKMVACLSKAKCILERICNINQQSSNGLKAVDVARSPDGCGMRPFLKNYSNKFKRQYEKQIVPNGWDWSVNPKIEQLICDLCNYFAANAVEKVIYPKLHFRDKLYENREPRKRKFTDFEEGYSFNTPIETSKPPKTPMLSYSSCSFFSSTDPNGGG